MLYNVTNKKCNNISTGDFIEFLRDKYPNESYSDVFYRRVIVQDCADNCYSIVALNNTENDYALVDAKRGLATIIDDIYIMGYKGLLDKLLEDGYKITYNDELKGED